MPRRSKDNIIADILEVCLVPGLSKTNVVYQANLNLKTALPYLDLLTRGGAFGNGPGRVHDLHLQNDSERQEGLEGSQGHVSDDPGAVGLKADAGCVGGGVRMRGGNSGECGSPVAERVDRGSLVGSSGARASCSYAVDWIH